MGAGICQTRDAAQHAGGGGGKGWGGPRLVKLPGLQLALSVLLPDHPPGGSTLLLGSAAGRDAALHLFVSLRQPPQQLPRPFLVQRRLVRICPQPHRHHNLFPYIWVYLLRNSVYVTA